MIAWLVAELIQFITRLNNIQNLWISYLLTPVQLVLMALYYRELLPQRRMLVYSVFALGFLIAIVETLIRPLTALNSVSLLYQCFTIVFVGMLCFYQMLSRGIFKYVWSNGAFVILFMGSAVYYSAFLNLDNMNLLRMLSTGHTVLLIFVYTLLTVEAWKPL
ncbi:hypothetical protein WSM22_03260 [Cytophagales bacterium WSM2-2]|nr:hypothetical protein WSM22_03260 [Cytophagales bacterium WSM2-2]